MFNFIYGLICLGSMTFGAFILAMTIITGEEPWFIYIAGLAFTAVGCYGVGQTLESE